MSLIPRPVTITAADAACGLGEHLESICDAIRAGRRGARPLREFGTLPERFHELPGYWLGDRGMLSGRKYGAVSNLAVAMTRRVLSQVGWRARHIEESWIFVGSSRGNTGELLGARHGRRPMPLYAASNSMHSEIAAAISIECGILAPWQTLSNGCSSGLDALIWAAHAVSCGLAPRAIVVGIDLPLAGALLADFASTGLLTSNGVNDPYSPATTGFFPAEAVAALTIEPNGRGTHLVGAWMNSDAYDPVGLPPDGRGTAALLRMAWEWLGGADSLWRPAICPHASGTRAHGLAEHGALATVLAERGVRKVPTSLLKPFTGHSLGASGALDTAILHAFLANGALPPNLPGLAGECAEIFLPETVQPVDGRTILKISVGMGGHNALVALRPSHDP
jgi:3-oxoacyl-[acyl-carrier-protein] synthase II